jgi:hypothetical protein
MLAPKDFVTRWGTDGDPLQPFPKSAVGTLATAEEDKTFLLQAGLPSEAAPFLTFEVPSAGELTTVAAQWNLGKEFQRYRAIGSDGSGNPFAIDEGQGGEVVCLDHDNRFSRVLVNKSVRQLAESLLAYRKLVEDTRAEFGDDAFLDGKTSPAARARLQQELSRIDSDAMQPGCFWHGELQNLSANA